MSEIRPSLRYTQDHEWAQKLEAPKSLRIGITDFAQHSLGDVTFLEMPAVGKSFKKGEILGTVESVKAVSDIYAPVAGKITAVNEALNDDPAVLNSDPYGAAWLVEIEMENEGDWNDLLSADAYAQVAQ
jgi:glycine cleavage system H protein